MTKFKMNLVEAHFLSHPWNNLNKYSLDSEVPGEKKNTLLVAFPGMPSAPT